MRQRAGLPAPPTKTANNDSVRSCPPNACASRQGLHARRTLSCGLWREPASDLQFAHAMSRTGRQLRSRSLLRARFSLRILSVMELTSQVRLVLVSELLLEMGKERCRFRPACSSVTPGFSRPKARKPNVARSRAVYRSTQGASTNGECHKRQ